MGFGDKNKQALEPKHWVKVSSAGDEAEVCFIGDEVVASVRFDGQRFVESHAEDARTRFMCNCYDTAGEKIGIFGGPIGMAKAIYKEKPAGDDVVKITRSGAAKSTKYEAEIVRKLTDKEKEYCEGAALYCITTMWAADEDGAPPPPIDNEDLPF